MTDNERETPMPVNRWTTFWFVVSTVLILVVIFGGVGVIYERNNDSDERQEWMRACHHTDYHQVIGCLERTP